MAIKLTDPNTAIEVYQWYARYAEIIDEKLPNEWVDCFSENGVYAIGTHNNVSTTGAWWYTDRGTVHIKERAAYNAGYYWHRPTRTLLTISNLYIREDADGRLLAKGAFVMYAADHQGESRLHVTGRYSDILERTEDGFRFVEHRAVIDAETIPSNMGVCL